MPAADTAALHAGDRFYQGVRVFILSSVLSRTLAFLTSIVLARTLLPRHFGLFALGALVFQVATSVVDAGLPAALVQRSDLRSHHLDAAFWMQLTCGLAVACALGLSAPILSRLLDDPELEGVLQGFAPVVILAALPGTALSVLQRRLRFRALGTLEVLSSLSQAVVSCALALAGFGVSALVAGVAARHVATTLGSWWLTSFRPQAQFSSGAAADLLAFALPTTGTQLLATLSERVDVLVIAETLGTVSLGYYNRAYYLVRLLGQQIGEAIHLPGFAAMSRLHADAERIGRGYMRMVSALAVIALPALGGMYLTASAFVIALYTEKWAPIIPLVQILSPAGALWAINAVVAPVLLARGQAGTVFRLVLFRTVLLTFLLLIGATRGLTGVAVAITGAIGAATIANHAAVLHSVGGSARQWIAAVWPPILCSAIMVASVSNLEWWVSPTANPWAFLSIAIPAAAGVYVATMAVVGRTHLRDCLHIFRELAPSIGRLAQG